MAYGGYRARSHGRIMHFLYTFDWNLDNTGAIGPCTVYRGSKTLGYYVWEHDTDYPIFFMINPEDQVRMNAVIKDIRERELRLPDRQWKRSEAIAYREKWDKYRKDRLYASCMSLPPPERPEVDDFYNRHTAI